MRRVTLPALLLVVLLCGAASGVLALVGYQSVTVVMPGLASITGINGYGQVTGVLNPPSGPATSFVWTPFFGGVSYLGGSGYRTALGINDGGDIVGRDGRSPIVWPKSTYGDSGDSLPGLALDNPPGRVPAGGCANAVNNKRQIVGALPAGIGYWDLTDRAVLWNSNRDGTWSSPVRLDALPNEESSAACDINDSGQAVGWATDASGHCRPVFWEPGKSVRRLAELPGSDEMRAKAINTSGAAVGSAVFGNKQVPVRWLADGTLQELMRPLGLGSGSADDINIAGQIVGNTLAGATLWDIDGGAYSMPVPTGISYTKAFAINNEGWIAGIAGDSSGQCCLIAWAPGWGPLPTLLSGPPVQAPEPAGLVTLALGGLGALLRHRRR